MMMMMMMMMMMIYNHCVLATIRGYALSTERELFRFSR